MCGDSSGSPWRGSCLPPALTVPALPEGPQAVTLHCPSVPASSLQTSVD